MATLKSCCTLSLSYETPSLGKQMILIHRLRLAYAVTVRRDGPVLNVDDDCRILPEILRKMWKVSLLK